MHKISGVYTALITPFTQSEQFDEKGFIQLIHRQIDAKVHGIVILGSTGESPTLTENERKRMVEIAVSHTKNTATKLMVGISSSSTREAQDLAYLYQSLGAEMLMVATPPYNKPTQEGLFLHFQKIALSVDIPICLYNVPSRCVQNIAAQTVERLVSSCSNIVSIKETANNFTQMADLIATTVHKHSYFSVLTGDDIYLLPLLSIGGHGVVSVISNLIPKKVVALYDAFHNHDHALAQALFYTLKPLIDIAFIETNPMPIKALMQQIHLPSGPCRLPLSPITKESSIKVREFINAYQHVLEDE